MTSMNSFAMQRNKVDCPAFRGDARVHGGILSRPRQRRPARATQSDLEAPIATLPLERTAEGFPSFIPKEYVDEIVEPACLDVLRNMQLAELEVAGLGSVKTAFVHAPYTGDVSDKTPPAFVLLHGFDSSMLEFRRFISKLAPLGDVYAVDLAGWGFSDCGFAENAEQSLGPEQKRDHLKSFIQKVVQRPVTLLGTSLGGSVAIDFAAAYQNVHVNKLVLVDAQGFIDGIGPMSKAPRFLSVLGVQVLKSVGLRQMANKMAYFDKGRYATDDAMRIGRLHTHLDGWVDANVAFMKSGGYDIVVHGYFAFLPSHLHACSRLPPGMPSATSWQVLNCHAALFGGGTTKFWTPQTQKNSWTCFRTLVWSGSRSVDTCRPWSSPISWYQPSSRL